MLGQHAFFFLTVLTLCRGSLLCNHRKSIALGFSFNVSHCIYRLGNITQTHGIEKGGYFLVVPVGVAALSNNLAIVGRIVGPIISELIFSPEYDIRIERRKYKAIYYHLVPGIYRVNIEIRYTNFDPDSYENAIVYSINNEIVKEYFFEVPPITLLKRTNSTSIDERMHLHNCSVNALSKGGHWIALATHQMPSKWLLDEGFLQISAQQKFLTAQLTDSLLYTPRYCRLKKINSLSFCEHKYNTHEMCFVGDSQIRHLTGTIYAMLEQNYSFFKPQDGNRKTDKAVYLNDHMHYVVDNWANMEFSVEESALLSRCNSILLNFGQWHVSYSTKPDLKRGPFKVSEYASLVNRTLSNYSFSFPHAKIYFLGTLPFGQSARLYMATPPEDEQRDYRNDVVLRAINAAGMEICRRLKRKHLRCINLFEMGNVVRDLSYDLAHFKAPVGPQMALAVLTALCSDP